MSSIGVGIAPADIFWTIQGFEGTWAQSTGPDLTVGDELHYDGGDDTPIVYAGRPEYSMMDLSRSARYPRDVTALAALRADVKAKTVQRTISGFIKQSGSTVPYETFIGIIRKVSPAAADADSTSKSTISVSIRIISEA